MFTTFDKAIVAFIGPALLTGLEGLLNGVGVTGDMSVNTLITSGVTALLVWLFPNAKKS